jgi:hypothetical protein
MFYSLIQDENLLHLSSGEPKYWPSDPTKLPDILDFFITKGTSSNYADVVSSVELTSDHTPVIDTISTTVIYKSPKPSLYNNNTDWALFKENVRNNLRLNISLKTEQEIEEATNDFILQYKEQPGQRPQQLQRLLEIMLIFLIKFYS